MAGRDRPLGLVLVLAYLTLSGSYHLLDGLALVWAGAAVGPINQMYAALSVVLGTGLLAATIALFRVQNQGRLLGAGIVVSLVVLLDLLAILLAGSIAAGLDLFLCLLALGYLVNQRSVFRTESAAVEEADSVHSMGRNYR